MNRCLALCVDIVKQKEIIVTGADSSVYECIAGKHRIAGDIQVYERELGSMLFDLSDGIRMGNYLKAPASVNVPSDNVTCLYIKSVIDSFLADKNTSGDYELFEYLSEELEITQTALITSDFISKQRHISYNANKNPNVDSLFEQVFGNMYSLNAQKPVQFIGTDGGDFVITDIAFIPIIKYYLRTLYKNSLNLILRIERAANYSRKKKEMYVGGTKTEKSVRVLIIPQIIADLYQKHKEQEISQKKFMGIRHTDEDYLFCDTT